MFDDLPTGFEWVANFETAAEKTLARPVHPQYAKFSAEIADKFNDMLGGVKSVEQGLGEMDASIAEIIGGGPTGIPGYELPFFFAIIGMSIGLIILLRKRK